MLLHTFININTCFDLSTLDHLTQSAIDFDKENDIHHIEEVKLHHCNNIQMFKEYIANHFDDFAHDIKIVNHVVKTAKGIGKFVALPTVVKVKTIGMGLFKMIKFINWFYKYHKKLYLESKKGHKHQLISDFSNKKFHLKDVKNFKPDYLDSIYAKTSNKHKHFGDTNVDDFFEQMLNHTDSDEKITFGRLKKKLEKVTPLLIDIKHHIDPEEECFF